MRALRILASIAAVALLCGASARADAGNDLAQLLRDFRQAEANIAQPALKDNAFDPEAFAAYFAKRREVNAGIGKRLDRIDREGLNDEDRLSYDIFRWNLEDDAGELQPGVAERFALLPYNQFDGSYLTFAREARWRADGFTRARDYDNAIRRMLDFTRRIDRAIAEMREGIKEDVTQPRVLVTRMLSQVEAIADEPLEDSVFMAPLKRPPQTISGPERARIESAYREAVEGQLLPAYRRLGVFLKSEYLPKARETLGLSALPGGKAMYLHLVKSETTTDLTPEQIRDLGLSELTRIEAEELVAMKAAGFTGSLDKFRDFLRTDPRFKFRTPGAMLAEFNRVRDVALAHLDSVFAAPPRSKVEFRFYEPYAAPDKPAAEYTFPSRDGRQPGIVYLNDSDLPARPTYTSEALELHEGIPGHHLQVALAAENRSLPNFRRYGSETAYTEGWALYAESLGPELGLYTDPYQKFGELSFDAWRACRLLVDTGIHWFGWTHDRAVNFLMAHTTLSEAEASVEVDRYVAIPAQALAYKIGEREFLDLKARAQAALGPKFDIKRFHAEVLKDGAMPLAVLDAHVKAWIAEESAAG